MTTQPDNFELPIIDKIKKMLAVQRSTNHEGEAQAAASLIQKLLQDHGLSMAQVEAASGKKEKDDRGRIKTDRRAMYKWQRDLMGALAQNHFCRYFVSEVDMHDGRRSRKSKQHVLLGRSVYVAATLSLYDYLVIAVKRAAREQGYDHAGNEKDHHAFVDGAIERLTVRLNDLRREREVEEETRRNEAARRARHPGAAPNGSGTEIVLAEVYQSEHDLNEDFLKGLEPGTTARQRAAAKAKRAAQQAHYDRLQAEGVDSQIAYLIVYSGYSAERARQIIDHWAEEERIEAAKPKRRARASRSRGSSRGPSQADQSRWERESSPAYKAGGKTADGIGLQVQIGGDRSRRISK